jgi:hypothetical protein
MVCLFETNRKRLPIQRQLGRWALACFASLVVTVPFSLRVMAQTSKPSQTDVQAIYLYNFAKFVRWPAPSTGAPGVPIDICIAGQKAYVDTLAKTVAGEQIDARPLTVRAVDIPGFLERGGTIQFLLIDNRVRFSVNLESINRSQITLSSELLKVAVAVSGKPGGGTR